MSETYTRKEARGVLGLDGTDSMFKGCEIVLSREKVARLYATLERGYRTPPPPLLQTELITIILDEADYAFGVTDEGWNLWELTQLANDLGYAVSVGTQPGSEQVLVSVATGAHDKRVFRAPTPLSAGDIIAALCYDHIRNPFDKKKDVSHFLDPYEVK